LVLPLDAVDSPAVGGAVAVDELAGLDVELEDPAQMGVGGPVRAGHGLTVGSSPDVATAHGNARPVFGHVGYGAEDPAVVAEHVYQIGKLVHHEQAFVGPLEPVRHPVGHGIGRGQFEHLWDL